jgi:hypothetical protein
VTVNGIQVGPHTILDEGIERTLDRIQDAAAINVVMPYSHAYNNALVKPLRARADHGVPLTDNVGRKFPLVYVRTHEQYYTHTTLRHQIIDNTFEHHDRDLFAELVEPARRRGMKVYARVLESASMARVVASYASDQLVSRQQSAPSGHVVTANLAQGVTHERGHHLLAPVQLEVGVVHGLGGPARSLRGRRDERIRRSLALEQCCRSRGIERLRRDGAEHDARFDDPLAIEPCGHRR